MNDRVEDLTFCLIIAYTILLVIAHFILGILVEISDPGEYWAPRPDPATEALAPGTYRPGALAWGSQSCQWDPPTRAKGGQVQVTPLEPRAIEILAAEDPLVKPVFREPPNGVGCALRDGTAQPPGDTSCRWIAISSTCCRS